MAQLRGRGGRGRGNRGRVSTRGNTGRLARSGIRTKSGYRKFDSQRVKEVDDSDHEEPNVNISEPFSEGDNDDDVSEQNDIEGFEPSSNSYSVLLQSFQQPADEERSAKRRKVEEVQELEPQDNKQEIEIALVEEFDGMQYGEASSLDAIDENEDTNPEDPFEAHFAHPDESELSRCLKDVQTQEWTAENGFLGSTLKLTGAAPKCAQSSVLRKNFANSIGDLAIKERLQRNIHGSRTKMLSTNMEKGLATYMFAYQDLLFANRTPGSGHILRNMASLHAVNHVLKGRDKILKNNERLMHTDTPENIEAQDQGYVRPKVLILLETREMAARYANAIVDLFQPEQQENRKRFDDSFTDPLESRGTMPDDYRELFDGNNDNSFLTALKFTRKTLKFYSAFYSSDIILASPLGLRRILENEDVKKRDFDFLSSIEIAIIDQADAMQMQNWDNVEVVMKHLNLELREFHGADFSRVRSWCLDGHSKYLRQTIVFSSYLTPELNKLYNTGMLNFAGKLKVTPQYTGAIAGISGLDLKQMFNRFDSSSPIGDPDARFQYFTSAILPSLLRIPKAQESGQGILIFIPSYYDFLRIRNYFATSDQTANISFGAIHDYSEVPDQRRARSHFLNGRHSFLLYTQRAHHFFRLRIRGVKRVVMYALPDNPIFYREIVEGFLASSLQEGKVGIGDTLVRSAVSKWDGLRLERVVGSSRVKGMLGGIGDTFEFV